MYKVSTRYRPRRLLLDSGVSIPLGMLNSTSDSYSGDANFDGNMVIILVALLCALVCALCLNTIIRCGLRCSRRNAYRDGREAVGTVPVIPMDLKKDAALGRIPAVVYKSDLHIPATDCPICLGEFSEGEDVRILPRCSHGYHAKCIDRWLGLDSSCPTCRQPVAVGGAIANTQIGGVILNVEG